MDKLVSLTTGEQWKEAHQASATKPLLVFKHSTRCSISAGAYDELTRWLADRQPLSLDCALVLVVENRAVSDAVADTTGLKHESPQAILLENGDVAWHASHWNITYSSLDARLRQHCEK